jgi:hypothetical protein
MDYLQDIMRRAWRELKGNPLALARLVVIVICLFVAVVLGILLPASPAVIVGSFLGAALSLTVNWLVPVLGEPDQGLAPTEFLRAAKSDIISAGYHRKNQSLRLSILSDEGIIKLHFSATLVPLNGQARIYRPRIEAPKGVQLIDSKYFVDSVEIPRGDDGHRSFVAINKTSADEFIVLYKITDTAIKEIEDNHLWPCPVLDYAVIFDISEVFTFDVGKIMPSDEYETLKNKRINNRNATITFFSDGAAFTRQGVVWKLTRN